MERLLSAMAIATQHIGDPYLSVTSVVSSFCGPVLAGAPRETGLFDQNNVAPDRELYRMEADPDHVKWAVSGVLW